MLRLETAVEEGGDPLPVLLGVSLEVVHVARVLQPPLLHPPAPPPGLRHHRGHEPPGDQGVALGVDKQERPPAPVLVLHPVADPAHIVRLYVQLPQLRDPEGEDVTEAASVDPVNSEVSPGEECSARRPGARARPPESLVTLVHSGGLVVEDEGGGPGGGVQHRAGDLHPAPLELEVLLINAPIFQMLL